MLWVGVLDPDNSYPELYLAWLFSEIAYAADLLYSSENDAIVSGPKALVAALYSEGLLLSLSVWPHYAFTKMLTSLESLSKIQLRELRWQSDPLDWIFLGPILPSFIPKSNNSKNLESFLRSCLLGIKLKSVPFLLGRMYVLSVRMVLRRYFKKIRSVHWGYLARQKAGEVSDRWASRLRRRSNMTGLPMFWELRNCFKLWHSMEKSAENQVWEEKLGKFHI